MRNRSFSVFMRISLFACFLLSNALVTACNFKEEKTSGDDTEDPAPDTDGDTDTDSDSKKISFAEIQTQILKPSCIGCHSAAAPSGGVSLDTYAKVKAEIAAINKTTVLRQDPVMPQNGSLSASKIQLLKSWIEQGAPENP